MWKGDILSHKLGFMYQLFIRPVRLTNKSGDIIILHGIPDCILFSFSSPLNYTPPGYVDFCFIVKAKDAFKGPIIGSKSDSLTVCIDSPSCTA